MIGTSELEGLGLDAAQLHSLTAHSPDVTMVLALDCRILFINWTAPGLSADQVIGTEVFNYVPKEQHGAMRECFNRVRLSGHPGTYRNVYELEEGNSLHWESRVAPIKKAGKIVGFTVFSRDVTERNTRTRELDEFFELSLDFLCILGVGGEFLRVNRTFTRVLGYAEEELLHRPLSDVLHPEDVAQTETSLGRVDEGISIVSFDNRCRTKDGRYRRLGWRGRADAERKRILAVARDVTEQHALEAQVREVQKMDAVGQLAGGIAHDLNNLMLAVLANCRFVQDELREGQERAQTSVMEIARSGERAAALTKQLLSFARREPFSPRAIDVNALCLELLDLLRRIISENIRLEFLPEDALPQVSADPARVEQVLMNLCVNARDAMPSGGLLTVSTRRGTLGAALRKSHPWAKASEYVVLSVGDTGRGMSQTVKERVFEPFFTTKQPGEGTGLGLSTAYGIVEQHGGVLSLESEPGAGSRVDVYLPAVFGNAVAPAPPEQPPARTTATILVAEDEALVRNVVVQILERAGHRVVPAKNGQNVLDVMGSSSEHFDLVILDVVMPELSGPEAYERLLEQRPGLPVIFTSGYADHARLPVPVPERHEILAKPYRNDELLARVAEALKTRT